MNQNFSTVFLKQSCLTLQKRIHNSSLNWANHYETLKLKKNCTSKEIRDSFIKLSKKNHPDINKSPDAHKEFLKIQEAYSVLSKPDARAYYDLTMSHPSSGGMRYESRPGNWNSYGYGYGPHAGPRYGPHAGPRYTRPPYGNPWDDPSFYDHRDRSKGSYYDDNSYYGVKGVKRMSNGSVGFWVGLFTVVMFVFQMAAIRHSVGIQQNIMNQRSKEAQMVLDEVRARAERNGNEVQVEILKKQFEEMERKRAEQARR